MQISWPLLCCTILQAAYQVDILVITLLHNIVGSVLCRYLGHYSATNTVGSVLCRYLGRYFAEQYCKQRTLQISWSFLCCTILQAAYYVDIFVITLLHNTVGSVLYRYLVRYFAAQYCRQRTMYIFWLLLCCTILQAAYNVDNLVITLLLNTVGSVLCRYLCISVLCRYLGRYFAAQYCRQSIMQISWSLLCCTLLQAAFYVDILVITLLHNIVGSVLCRYLGHFFAAQYFRQCTMQISWSSLCCTILQAAYYVGILVITLLHNIAAQYCRQRTMHISWSLLCCSILQATYYLDILVITLLHKIVGSILCR